MPAAAVESRTPSMAGMSGTDFGASGETVAAMAAIGVRRIGSAHSTIAGQARPLTWRVRVLSACSGKVKTGFPTRTCATQKTRRSATNAAEPASLLLPWCRSAARGCRRCRSRSWRRRSGRLVEPLDLGGLAQLRYQLGLRLAHHEGLDAVPELLEGG